MKSSCHRLTSGKKVLEGACRCRFRYGPASGGSVSKTEQGWLCHGMGFRLAAAAIADPRFRRMSAQAAAPGPQKH
jgi:hypothetical protein